MKFKRNLLTSSIAPMAGLIAAFETKISKPLYLSTIFLGFGKLVNLNTQHLNI